MLALKDLLPLFVLEMANNHMGDLEHGLRIVREMRRAVEGFDFKFGFKLQYRSLDTFIHPGYRGRSDFKYVKRFSETRLEAGQFKRLVDEMAAQGFVTICTPFDEPSVDLIEAQGIDILKVASCSFTDWPLLERIAQSKKPVIASTAGAVLEDIDRVVSFFEHREKELALMHCVGEYPTPPERMQLNQIDLLRGRYPKVTVGFSTHEAPDNYDLVKLAAAKGGQIFEKHVGVPDEQHPLNAYSASPEQVHKWVEAAALAFSMCGQSGKRPEPNPGEQASLRALRRGVYARRKIETGERFRPEDLFYAIPTLEGHVTANDLSKYTEFVATEEIPANGPLLETNTRRFDRREQVYATVQQVKEFLIHSQVPFPPKADLELSHHYGIERFGEYGMTMITVVNRAYCKKLMVLLPGQQHPTQYHEEKEETFHILYGEVWVDLDGEKRLYQRGEVVTIEHGVRHSFCTQTGVVIEEISSTHFKNDSYYTDPAIMANRQRKTLLTYWLS